MGNLSTKIVGIITAILVFISLYLVFGYARIEGTMLEVQKIFYYHVSAALTVFVAFGVNCVFSIKYLIQRKPNDDLLAVACSGNWVSSFARLRCCRVQSGRDTRGIHGGIGSRVSRVHSSSGSCMSVYFYFSVSALEDDKRRLYSAVLGIIAYLDVPIVYYAVDIWHGGLHPDRGNQMEPRNDNATYMDGGTARTHHAVYAAANRAVSDEESGSAL